MIKGDFVAWIVVAILFQSIVGLSPARGADSAVVFMYHRFGEVAHPSTNIKLIQFDRHVEEILQGGYSVLPLPEIIDKFRRKQNLPDRTIALTIDDAFLSVYNDAWPRLKRAGIPFTLFVATDPIDRRREGYMNWEQISELAAAGVTIGNQTVTHPHLPDVNRKQLRRELVRSGARFSEKIGFTPKLLAYPFGEFGLREKKVAKEVGFTSAFGQHSGVAYANDDLYALPRFAMNENYGSLKRFRLAASALPIRVFDITPSDNVLRVQNPPAFGFTLEKGMGNTDRLSCFSSNQSGPAEIERLGRWRLEVRVRRAFEPRRGRINCTMPASEGRWRWFGTQFYVPPAN